MLKKENNKFSKLVLSIPCAILIIFNFCSAYYINKFQIYNGDFEGIQRVHESIEVWFYALIGSIPYIILYIIIKNIKIEKKRGPIIIPKIFVVFSILILLAALVLTLIYGVGITGAQLYQAPIIIKPIIVLINRIDPVVLTGIIILSSNVKLRTALLVGVILLLITINRSSLQSIPYLMVLFYFRYMAFYSNIKKTNNYKIFIIFAVIGVLIVFIAPELFIYRDEIRGVEKKEIEFNLEEFIFGKLVGRLSNLSALLIFESRTEIFNMEIDKLNFFSYLADTLKYFWGGFTNSLTLSHYDYFTSMLDPNAYGYYAMQTGVLPAIGLSYMRSPIAMIIDITITIACIYFTVKLSTYILADNGKYLALALLIFAVLSGAPSQFSLPAINLAVIAIVLKIFKTIKRK